VIYVILLVYFNLASVRKVLGWSSSVSLPVIPSELKFGEKWSASYYWQTPYWMDVFYTWLQGAFVTVSSITGKFEDGTLATVKGN